jgi:acyl carrier protein
MNSLQKQIADIISNTGVNAETITLEADLQNLGVDSMRLMEVVAELENTFNVELPLEDLSVDSLNNVLSISDIIGKLQSP